MAFIEVKDLKKVYKLDDVEIKALDGVDLTILQGEFVMILGQSGCGKSTLLNILGGMDKPTEGSVLAESLKLSTLKPDRLAKYRKEQVGMIFQKFNLIGDMSILENVMLPLKFSGYSEREQRRIASEKLELVGLVSRSGSTPTRLSGGQQQRVAIARALVNNPKILLCDEPTGNLDSKTGLEIIELLKSLNEKGITVIIVTHNEAYSKYATRIIKMLDGKIIDEKISQKSVAKDCEPASVSTISFFARLKLALKNIKRRKLRIFLTSFGVAIGAMAIVILVAFGAGLKKDITDQMQSVSQVEEISVSGEKQGDYTFAVGPSFSRSEKKNLNDKTIADFSKIDKVAAVYPSINFNGELVNGDKIGQFYVEGASPLQYVKQATKDKVKYGGYFTSDEENSVVIPYGLAAALGFNNVADAIGKEVTAKNFNEAVTDQEFKLKIVGVLSQDEKYSFSATIPLNTSENWLKIFKAEEIKKADPDLYSGITVRADNASNVSAIKKSIDDMGFGTTSYEDIAKTVSRSFNIMQIVLGVVGSIALIVASLGIVNTMLMSILERTKEIGVMKAVGARMKDIRSIFSLEAMLIGLIGGLSGLLLGYLGTKLIGAIANSYLSAHSGGDGQTLSFFIPYYLSFGVVVFSILISALAGYFPSRRAAKLDPVIALRDE